MKRKLLIAVVTLAMVFPALAITGNASAQSGDYPQPHVDTMSTGERAERLAAAQARALEIAVQIAEKDAPFDEEYAAYRAELAVAYEPFKRRLEAVESKKFQAMRLLNDQRLALRERHLEEALLEKRRQLIQSFADESQAIRDEFDVAFSYLTKKKEDIAARRQAAIGALLDELIEVDFEIFSLTPPAGSK
jgi:hypothetical protein